MSDDLVPCKHATDYEIARGLHLTREEEGICNPCISLLDLFDMKRADAEADEAVARRIERNQEAQAAARALHPSSRIVGEEED